MQFCKEGGAALSLLLVQHRSKADARTGASVALGCDAGDAIENGALTAAKTKAASKTAIERTNQTAMVKDCLGDIQTTRVTRIVDTGLSDPPVSFLLEFDSAGPERTTAKL